MGQAKRRGSYEQRKAAAVTQQKANETERILPSPRSPVVTALLAGIGAIISDRETIGRFLPELRAYEKEETGDNNEGA